MNGNTPATERYLRTISIEMTSLRKEIARMSAILEKIATPEDSLREAKEEITEEERLGYTE